VRHVIVAAIALVVGLVVGGVGQRAQLAAMTAEIRDLRDRRCDDRPGDLTRLFGGSPAPTASADPDAAPEPAPRRHRADAPLGDDETPPAHEPPRAEEDTDEAEPPRIEGARTALAARRAQARAALIEDADPTADQLADVDSAVDDMNAQLDSLARDLVDRVQAGGGELSRREQMQFAADGLDVMLTAQTSIEDALDDDQRAAVDEEAIDPFSYIDPALMDLIEQLDQARDE
jgi:hypothetical protein